MSLITAGLRITDSDALMDAAVAARHDDGARVGALRAPVTHAFADHETDLTEHYVELGGTLARLNRYHESLEAFEAAIAAGQRGLPYPRTNVAGMLLQAGRRQEADAHPAELRDLCPEDIWLYDAAGLSYIEVGEHATAFPWWEVGMAMGMADDDDTGCILGQLNERRTRRRQALGLADDEMTARVAAFEPPEHHYGAGMAYQGQGMLREAQPDRSACSHCGGDPQHEGPTEMHLGELEWLADNLTRRPRRVAHNLHEPVRVVKVGRNTPRPCGSGRKHMHCCGR
jgi:tetratricopeptide (TPR) repeat protein